MKITYDEERDVVYLQLMEVDEDEGIVAYTAEAGDGVQIDYTKEGEVFGIEILDACENLPLKEMVAASRARLQLPA